MAFSLLRFLFLVFILAGLSLLVGVFSWHTSVVLFLLVGLSFVSSLIMVVSCFPLYNSTIVSGLVMDLRRFHRRADHSRQLDTIGSSIHKYSRQKHV